MLFEDTSQLHESVIQLLPQEEQEKQNNAGFVEDVKKWLSDANRKSDGGAVQTSSDGIVILPQAHLPCHEPLDAHNNENDSCVSEHSESCVGKWCYSG